MLKRTVLSLFIVLSFFTLSSLNSDTIIVNVNSTGDYTYIQQGIDNSVNGDTVLVYPGTYFENINYNGKNIILASLYLLTHNNSYIDSTIIDGNQNGSVVTFESGEDSTVVLCGFTIQNGSGTYYLHNYHGGGLLCKNAHPTISNCNIENNVAEQGGGISCVSSHIHLIGTTIKNNYAEYGGGGIFLANNSNASFNAYERCNIFLNYGSNSCDLRSINCDNINIIVDTFTVSEPDNYFSYPVDYFTFNILNSKIEPINQDLYVSPVGDNSNSGLTPVEPLKNISYALTKIASDSTHPNTIHLANGIYSPSLTEEIFPLNCRSYVSIIGENEVNTILDGNNLSGIIACVFGDNFFSIENLTVKNGFASNGGGISFSVNSSPTIKNVTIEDNSVTGGGGGVLCYNNSCPVFEDVSIINNYAGSVGGGICISNSSPVLKNVIISGNIVDTVWGSSAGINVVANSNPLLINVAIINNISGDDGSILGTGNNGCPELNNITISGNNIIDNVIYCMWNDSIYFNNCILYNTEAYNEIKFYSNGYSNLVSISYTDIKDGEAGIQTNGAGTVNWLEGNIDSIPQFVGGDPFSYELTKYSPCIDAGTPDTTGLHLPATDLAGNQRIYNGKIDIGAYEYQGYGIDEPDTSFVHNLYLFKNTPNPFKESTTISFISADYERIKEYTLSIYNTKGQLVRRYEGSKDDFWVRTEIVWNGTDEQGKQVAPGTYLYKLEYNGHAVVRKMIRLR
ncbi:MAG: choice-of-anchor Q domain-containing protein [Candidatus Celaenobacter antarcticus]|nr:choice-of-anchor Q domain-containing protein [Candidatus Celaenobacter antarcticus]